ncbi:MAG: tetratricopeptide repeat protein [Candidatus Omnitrophota bacterium]
MEQKRKKNGTWITIILLVPLFTFWHWFEPAARKNREGIEAYRSKKYDEALKHFLSAKGIKPDMAALKSNTASALYQMKKYKEALEEFSKIDPAKAGISQPDFYYNLGNSYFRENQFDKALENYKKSLIQNPGDRNAKKNFELTLKKLEEQKKQDKENKNDKNNKNNKNNKDNKDQKDQKQDQKDQKDQNKKDQDQPQKQEQPKEEKYKNLMQYLNQNEKNQLKKEKRSIGIVKKEKDW